MDEARNLRDADLTIVGGGLVGASLALALEPLGLDIALIEAQPPEPGLLHPSFDERSTAISNGSVRVFRALGAWQQMRSEASPIRRIHVTDRGRFGVARIGAYEPGLEAQGWVLPKRANVAALWERIRRSDAVRLIAPARVESTSLSDSRRQLALEHGGERCALGSRLVVAADGARSAVREQAGIAA